MGNPGSAAKLLWITHFQCEHSKFSCCGLQATQLHSKTKNLPNYMLEILPRNLQHENATRIFIYYLSSTCNDLKQNVWKKDPLKIVIYKETSNEKLEGDSVYQL